MPCWLYILYSASKDRFYVGVTQDLDDRIRRHNEARNLSTKAGIPWELFHCEPFDTRAQAASRERQIKSWKSAEAIRRLKVTA